MLTGREHRLTISAGCGANSACWKSGADQIQSALAQISTLLNTAATNYDSTESQIASSFGS